MSHHQNLVRIKAVYRALEELGEVAVFVGGATVSLYTDRIAEDIRPTDDIDILVEPIWNGLIKDESLISQALFVNF